jgi:hypothetical protein
MPNLVRWTNESLHEEINLHFAQRRCMARLRIHCAHVVTSAAGGRAVGVIEGHDISDPSPLLIDQWLSTRRWAF